MCLYKTDIIYTKRKQRTNKILRASLVFIICLLILLCSAGKSSALFRRDFKKAKDYIKLGIYPHAIPLLEKAVLEHPLNAEVNFLLGKSYINTGNVSGADDVFSVANHIDPAYGNTIGREYKQAADNALYKGDYASAGSLFDKAVEYDPELREKQGYDFFIALGNRTGNAGHYTRSITFAEGAARRQQVKEKLMKASTGCDGSDCGHQEEPESPITRKAELKRIMPADSVQVVFHKTYTFSDAYETVFGQIKTIEFTDEDIQAGDKIEVTAQLKDGSNFSGKEIGIWMQKSGSKGWIKTDKGYFSEKVEEIPNGSLIISLAKRRDIRVTVTVKREELSVLSADLMQH